MTSFIVWLIQITSKIIVILPRKVHLLLGDVLGIFVFDVIRLRRKLLMQHLSIAFPQWSDREKKRVARKSLMNMGRSLIEYFALPSVDRNWIDENVEIQGMENYEKAAQKGKGVLLLTLHVGNGDLALAVLALLGIKVYIVSKRFKAQKLNDVWFGLRKKEGLEIIPEEKSSYQILRALKGQGVVVFVLDQFMGPPAGVATRFFGKETGTAMGLALFASRSEAPVLPAYTYRKSDGRTVIVFEPAVLDDIQNEDLDVKHQQMTQRYTDIIEEIVKKHPEQWLWLHRRWKTFEVR